MNTTSNHPLVSNKTILISIALATLLFRLPFLLALKSDPVFLMPIIDSLEYHTWANEILHKSFLWTELQYHLPLYPYFLALLYKISPHVIFVAFAQCGLMSLTNILVYLIARKIFSQLTALISCLFMATYWMLIYTNSFLFCENLSLFFNTFLAYILLTRKDTRRKFFFSGILLGLSIISRPDILFFAFLLVIWLFKKSLPRNILLKHYLAFLVGVTLIVGPVSVRNFMISKEPVLLRTQVGINMYIGSLPQYKGAAAIEIGRDWEDLISLPERTLRRPASQIEQDKFFFQKTLEIITSKPLEWAKLMSGKLFSISTGREYLRSEDVYFYNHYIHKTPLELISTPLISTLAVIGILLLFAQTSKDLLLIYLLMAAEIFLLFFQIKTRYLMAIFPFVSILAAYTLSTFIQSILVKRFSKVFFIILMIFLFQLLFLYNPLRIQPPTEAETYYAIGKNFFLAGQPNKAVEYYHSALRINPKNLSVWNDLGLVYLNYGDCNQALKYFEEALRLDSNAIKPKLNHQICSEALRKTP